jgi:hypothetical protein
MRYSLALSSLGYRGGWKIRDRPGADIFDEACMIGDEQIANLLHLLSPLEMHNEDMAPSACLVQVHIAKEAIIG